jgi:hypothetical protein
VRLTTPRFSGRGSPRRYGHPLNWLPASRLLPPRSGLERSDFVHCPTAVTPFPGQAVPCRGASSHSFRGSYTAELCQFQTFTAHKLVRANGVVEYLSISLHTLRHVSHPSMPKTKIKSIWLLTGKGRSSLKSGTARPRVLGLRNAVGILHSEVQPAKILPIP